ncbi:MAG TPA: acyltransferase [Pyrinomonadaceae bacterium]|nr:acyltransferase [Pyrinomonadaceae bacterium]
MEQGRNRIEVLDFLRGAAALAVALHHFCNVLDDGPIRAASHYGQLGVQVFFVISGFIIPYSLVRGGYGLRNFGTFVAKRIVRLDPPYLVTIAVIIGLGVLSWYVPFQQGPPFEVSWPQVLLHLGYVNTFFGYPWLSDVFWTLAIEFQYYLLMGLAFPVVFSRDARLRLGAMAALGALSFVVTSGAFIFHYIFLFLMGILTCQLRTEMIGRGQYALLTALAVAGNLAVGGLPSTLAGALAVFAILFLRVRHSIFVFLGSISYSLYLIHSPVGRRGLNVYVRATGADTQAEKYLAVLFAVAVSIAAAYALYRLVELPSQRWSSSLRYHRRRRPAELRPEELEQLNPAL